ncbi:unnamed protein product [Rotaria sordida]|uniref:Saposin A-type domain-containing protein n=1 Tax=Rotaria sordida TaxID=392033 RepID=A0A814KEI9_9BILA|nr:unnamed protein product [Rotaria sordida]CAF1211274.1 unnamed protein product [Rotaria sordida]
MALHLFRDQFSLRPTSTRATVPDNDLARLMYYLNCVFNAIEYKDQDVRRYRDYHNWSLLSDTEQRAVLVFALALSPNELDGQVFFHSDELCGDSSNKFYELSQVRHQLLAVQSIVISGQTHNVKKIMTYKMSWIQNNYIEPVKRLTYYFNQQRERQIAAARAKSARVTYAYQSSPSNCPTSSADWCKTKEIAAACEVTKQCASFVWKATDNDRVNFTIYYEALCADCRQFIITQVWFAYQAVADIVNLTFIPYGNAHEVYRPETKLYQFYCQHGPDECYANLIHTCVIALYPETQQHIPFIYCMDSIVDDVEKVARQCAKNTSIDFEKVATCTNSRMGNQLQHTYAVETERTKPTEGFVPWVTLNGNHTKEIQDLAETDLISLICDTYKGPNPPARCKKIL